jgi:hypothetical protein
MPLTTYYAEFDDLRTHETTGKWRRLPNDGFWEFKSEDDAHAISDAINRGCDLSADLLIVYTEVLVNGTWTIRIVWERK